MKRRLLALIPFLVISAFPINAEQNLVRVDLGSISFTFTSESQDLVSIPLSLIAPSSVKIAKVSTEIILPSKFLSFTKGSAKPKGAKLEASVRPDPKDTEKSRLYVSISVEPGQVLASGVIAELEFKLSRQTPDGILVLPNLPQAYAVDNPTEPLEKVEGSFGSIEISTKVELFISCFFYMH